MKMKRTFHRNDLTEASGCGALSQAPSVKRVRQLVAWLGLSLNELSEYCNRSVPIANLTLILRGRQIPSAFERKALGHAISRAVHERAEILFEG